MGDIGKIVKSLSFIEEFVSTATALATERDIEQLLDKVLISVRNFTNCEGGRIYTLDVTKRILKLSTSHWFEQRVDGRWYTNRTLSSGSLDNADPLVYVMLTGATVIADDVFSYAGFNFKHIQAHDQAQGVQTHSLMMVPLKDHLGELIGILELSNARDAYNRRYVSFKPLETIVQAFAAQAAVCINNTLLIDKNRKLINILDHSNQRLEEENRTLRLSGAKRNHYEIIGNSSAMQSVFGLMDKVVDSNVTVLLRGETGTGKEVFARAIHEHGTRKSQPFVTQNCAALPEQLLESELFGYKKGAFTGANSEKKGLFDIAHGGTLFLDEIGDMPLLLQSKLLRVLQENEIRPLGALEPHNIDVRIIAATHCNLEEKIKKGEFREDLYFRLSIFPLQLPPLRARDQDVIALAEHFGRYYAENYRKEIAGFSPSTIEILLAYGFPGNVRELQNAIERAVLLCDTGCFILPDYLPDSMTSALDQPKPGDVEVDPMLAINTPFSSLKETVTDYEIAVIKQYLKANNWNQTRTAEVLQIPRRTLIDKMNRYSIATPMKRRKAKSLLDLPNMA